MQSKVKYRLKQKDVTLCKHVVLWKDDISVYNTTPTIKISLPIISTSQDYNNLALCSFKTKTTKSHIYNY